MTKTTEATMTKQTTGEQAINAALAAGFEITAHGKQNGLYVHVMQSTDRREIAIYTTLNGGQLAKAQGTGRWAIGSRTVKTLPKLAALLARPQVSR